MQSGGPECQCLWAEQGVSDTFQRMDDSSLRAKVRRGILLVAVTSFLSGGYLEKTVQGHHRGREITFDLLLTVAWSIVAIAWVVMLWRSVGRFPNLPE